MVCPRCGKEVPASLDHCPECRPDLAATIQVSALSGGELTASPGPSFDAATVLPTVLGGTPPSDSETPTVLVSSSPTDPMGDETAAHTPGTGTARVRPRSLDAGPLEVGEAFGARYHIIRMLGIGGMGAVYQAWDAELGVAVAIKVIRPDGLA